MSAINEFFTGFEFSIDGWQIGTIFLCLLATFVLARLARWVLERRAAAITKEKEGELGLGAQVLRATGRPVEIIIWATGIYLSVAPHLGEADSGFSTWLTRACKALAIFAFAWMLYRLVSVMDYYLKRWAMKTESHLDDMLAPMVGKALRVTVVIIAAMFIGQNVLGLNISTILASLGIGGLAVAFAAKDSIANIFGSMTIIADQPFKVGERVVVDGFDGPVEEVGLRSTKLRTLTGHLVTIPNEKIVNSTVENIGRRPHIRRLSNITITYDTPVVKVEKAVKIVRDVLNDHEGMKKDFPPRVYFNDFNDWSLNLIMIAWYHPPKYWDYLDWCQRTNLEIMRRFEKAGIEFAFPTTTTYLAGDPKRPLDAAGGGKTTSRGTLVGKVRKALGRNRK